MDTKQVKKNKKPLYWSEAKVYLTAENFNSRLSDKDIEILKKQGRFTKCPDYNPEQKNIIS